MGIRKPLRVKSPCPSDDPGFELRSDGTRFCRTCAETTHDLRDATRREVDALMAAHGGKLCALVRIGPSGEARFVPEPPPRGLSALGGAAIALALAACDGSGEATVTDPPALVQEPPPVSAPPASVPEAPPTTEAAPPAASSMPTPPPPTDDGIDHSTDASPDADHHRTHQHRHPPVPIDDDRLAVGGLG